MHERHSGSKHARNPLTPTHARTHMHAHTGTQISAGTAATDTDTTVTLTESCLSQMMNIPATCEGGTHSNPFKNPIITKPPKTHFTWKLLEVNPVVDLTPGPSQGSEFEAMDTWDAERFRMLTICTPLHLFGLACHAYHITASWQCPSRWTALSLVSLCSCTSRLRPSQLNTRSSSDARSRRLSAAAW
jgi:hypothetical protein